MKENSPAGIGAEAAESLERRAAEIAADKRAALQSFIARETLKQVKLHTHRPHQGKREIERRRRQMEKRRGSA